MSSYRPRPESQLRSRAFVPSNRLAETRVPYQRGRPAFQLVGDKRKASQRVGDWRIQRVSSVRDRKPVFVKIFRTWLSTVRSDRTSFLATSLFESAFATSSATSRSRAVNGSGD